MSHLEDEKNKECFIFSRFIKKRVLEGGEEMRRFILLLFKYKGGKQRKKEKKNYAKQLFVKERRKTPCFITLLFDLIHFEYILFVIIKITRRAAQSRVVGKER